MRLQNTDIFVDTGANILSERKFNLSTHCVSSLYRKKINKDYKTERWRKVLVLLHNEINNKSELPPERFGKQTIEKVKALIKKRLYYYENMVKDGWEIATVHRRFDFEKYFLLDSDSKKRMILYELHEGTKNIALHFGWNTEPFDNAYKKCLDVNLQNNWISKRLKTKSSPNRKYKGAVFFEYDIYEIRVFAVIFDKNGTQIIKNKLLTLNGLDKDVMFPEDIMPIVMGKTRWIKNDFILFDKKGNKIGTTTVV